MKHLKIKHVAILSLLFVFMCGSAKADNIDLQTAKQIGAYYFNVASGIKAPISAEKLELVQQFDNPTLCIPALYVFNVASNGFVVVSASNCTDPVLAYCPEGRLDNTSLNPACQYMLESYARIISENQTLGAQPTAQIKKKWDELTEQTFSIDPTPKSGILVKAYWGQGSPYYPSYNCMCPQISGRPCVTGCVATAMAAIIHYWKYPVVGNGTAMTSWNGETVRYKFLVDSNKFLYDSMPNSIHNRSMWRSKRAIGKLCFACGVTVNMDWGLESSGAVSQYVPNAFSQYFKYSTDVKHVQRAVYANDKWIALLHKEIDSNSRPVYYSACDPQPEHGKDARHAFVIAGSDDSDPNKFYIRWGWDGDGDGYFTLNPMSSIQSAQGYRFTTEHAMVYQIHPLDPLGIDENTAYTTTLAYPNPATEYIMIPVDMSLNAILTIYNIDGKMIKNMVVPAGTKEYRLDLRDFAPGTYVYRLNGSAVKFSVQ